MNYLISTVIFTGCLFVFAYANDFQGNPETSQVLFSGFTATIFQLSSIYEKIKGLKEDK